VLRCAALCCAPTAGPSHRSGSTKQAGRLQGALVGAAGRGSEARKRLLKVFLGRERAAAAAQREHLCKLLHAEGLGEEAVEAALRGSGVGAGVAGEDGGWEGAGAK